MVNKWPLRPNRPLPIPLFSENAAPPIGSYPVGRYLYFTLYDDDTHKTHGVVVVVVLKHFSFGFSYIGLKIKIKFLNV